MDPDDPEIVVVSVPSEVRVELPERILWPPLLVSEISNEPSAITSLKGLSVAESVSAARTIEFVALLAVMPEFEAVSIGASADTPLALNRLIRLVFMAL